ncbi:hypothetical protein K501DRAFT_260588 [Backusella circina FSU 941]|nr:hypothetical protein K501DRAFT_260588 [Backusella circina FSU 941]
MFKRILTTPVKSCYRLSTTRCHSTLNDVKQHMAKILDDAAMGKYGSKSTLHQLLQLKQELKTNHIVPDPVIYEYLLSAYAKADDPRKILVLLKEMKSKRMSPTKIFHQKALRFAAKAGDADVQAEVLESMAQCGIPKTGSVYRSMLMCMANNMELEHALDTMDEMKRNKVAISAHSYYDIIDLAVRLKQPALAFELLEEVKGMEVNEDKRIFFNMHVLRCAVLSGNYQTIKACWYKVIGETALESCPPDEGLCLGVLNAAGKSGDPHLASDVLRVLGQLGFSYRELHFSPLLEAFTLAGEMDKAFEIFTIMRNVGITPNRQLVTPVVRAFGEDAKAAMRAKECLDQRREEGREVDIVAFNLVLHVLSYNGHNEEAHAMFEKHSEYRVTPDTETLDAVLDACIHLKDLERGKMIYKEQTAVLKPTSTTLSKMVTLACTNEESYEDAFYYLEEMKHRGLTPLRGCYYKLAKTLSGAQDPRLQLVLDDMKEYGYEISSHLKNYMLLKQEYFEEQQRREEPFRTQSNE